MNFMLKTLFACLLLVLLVGASPVNINTNAQRLRRGLPPLKPRQLYKANRVARAFMFVLHA
jgi:hypothetical protein